MEIIVQTKGGDVSSLNKGNWCPKYDTGSYYKIPSTEKKSQ